MMNMESQYACNKVSDGQDSTQYTTPGTGEISVMTNTRGNAVTIDPAQIAAITRSTVFLVRRDLTGNTIARHRSAVMASNVPTEADWQIGNII